MTFRTNYKDEIATKMYQIVDANGDAIIHEKVRLNPNYKPTQIGDKFGATEVNAIHSRLNELADIDKVERGTFSAQIGGIYFPVNYTRIGKIVEFEVDVTLSEVRSVSLELTKTLPFDVYRASGSCEMLVSSEFVGHGLATALNRRLVLEFENIYLNPVTILASVTCIIK